jgi:ATP-dependent protease ClpP protease subunit
MKLESRKINLINWISTIQEEDILAEMERIQKERTDWWDTISNEDKQAINEGLKQLDEGQYISRSEARKRIKNKFNF